MTASANKKVAYWLLLGAFMIMIQIMLGGITRLTGSGLSITQWNVIMGSVPPLNDAQWQQAFDLYKETPQYKLMNSDMTTDGFKSIFWWEYIHRLWARLIGFAFIIPLIYFLQKKMINRQLGKQLMIIALLGALQALLGWIMVQSGLIDKPWVNPINLSSHLMLALILFSYILWVALSLLQPPMESGIVLKTKRFSVTLLVLLFLQILYGGLMAGNKAALSYPTFPKIGTYYIPDGLFSLEPWFVNFFENSAMIQLIHRTLGGIVAILMIYFFWQTRRQKVTALLKRALRWLPSLVILQVLLGILTLVNSLGRIPVVPGVLHQMVALLLLTVMVIIHFQLSGKRDYTAD